VQGVRPPEVWEHIAFERHIHSTVWYCHLMLSEGWFLSCDAVVPLRSAVDRNNQMNAVETTANCWLSCRTSRQISCGDVNWSHKANVQRSRRDASSYVYVCREQRQSGQAFRNDMLFFLKKRHWKRKATTNTIFDKSIPETIITAKIWHKSSLKYTVHKHKYKNIFQNCV
jgi:hypothetical protein